MPVPYFLTESEIAEREAWGKLKHITFNPKNKDDVQEAKRARWRLEYRGYRLVDKGYGLWIFSKKGK